MLNFTIGSDPEAFVVNDNSGNVVSSKRFTLGTKDEPEELGGGYAILNDNILIEGNVPPASNKEEFVANMNKLWEYMNERAKRREAHIHNADCMEISEALLKTDEAQEFGCSAFRDAWNGFLEIATPQLITRMRPAGCHIHLGFDEEHKSEEFLTAIVRAFDMYVTMPSIKITGENYRTSNMYGLLGACRLTSYGVECRSLGGTFFNPKWFGWIYDNVEKAVNFANDYQEFFVKLPEIHHYQSSLRIQILEGHVITAEKVLQLTTI